MALFIGSESMCNPHESLYLVPNLIINGFKIDPNEPGRPLFPYNLMGPNHTFLFDMQLHQRLWENKSKLGVPLLRNEWNCMEVRLDVIGICEPGFSSIEMGIHIFKQKSSMENIRFTDPCKKRKLDDDDHNSSDQSQNHLLVKKHRFGDLEAFDAICAAATTSGTLLSGMWNSVLNERKEKEPRTSPRVLHRGALLFFQLKIIYRNSICCLGSNKNKFQCVREIH